jgi:hypothetical protein
MSRLKLIPLLLAALTAAALIACGPDEDDGGGAGNFEMRSTRIEAPLPEDGFRAQLTPVNAPAEMAPGAQEVILVSIKNVSGHTWPALGMEDARYAITLRNRWLEPGGEKVVNDLDGGSPLQHDIRPGEEFSLPIKVGAPKQPGEYVLEFDMVQEQVTFFRERGSTPATVRVVVKGEGASGPRPATTPSPPPAAKVAPTSTAR